MANFEVIVSCDELNSLWSCNITDPHSGTSVRAYRGGGTVAPRSLSFIADDYIAALEKGKPLMRLWQLNSQQPVQKPRFVLPGPATSLAFSKDGNYFIAGVGEKIYLWQTASGDLLSIISRHYQPITVLKFTDDGSYFVSAAQDGMVLVWALVAVCTHPHVELISQRVAGQHDPLYSFSDHSLPVTDLHLSQFGIKGRMATVSVDRSCKIYDLQSGDLLLSIIFDSALLSLTMDRLELHVYVGTATGKIHRVSLMQPFRTKEHHVTNTDNSFTTSAQHSKGITCLSMSIDGMWLVSGGDDAIVNMWHVESTQLVRSIPHKGPITNLFFAMAPNKLYLQEFTPSVILHNLQKTIEKEAGAVTEIEVYTNHKINFWDDKEFENQQFVTTDNQSGSKLKDELVKMQNINQELYSFAINQILNNEGISKTPEPSIKRKSNKKKKKTRKT